MSRPVFIINFKNYSEILGEGALRLAETAEAVSETVGVEFILAPPVPRLSTVASAVRIPVFSQSVGNQQEGKSTGAIIPEALKASGCAGSIINHSESRVPLGTIRDVIPRMKGLGLASCVCGEDASEIVTMAGFAPEYLAVEPPELIGSGIAVSKARPELIRESVSSVRAAGYAGRLLCGAGIVTGEDARAAVRLGMDGILVASSVVKSKDWESKIKDLASALL
ncbi:MAG: triose-phosphate isomerase [Thaumarchaeota archaeon]|nr:triose-phosphate isomerase [Nitrososphaerota archaeon]